MMTPFTRKLSLAGLLTCLGAAGLAQATVVIDGSQGASERYLAAFNGAAGIDTNTNFGFGPSAKSERVATRNTPTHLNVFVEGSLHSGNRVFILIDTDGSAATGYTGGTSAGATFGEQGALSQFSQIANGGYDLAIVVQAQNDPATELEFVVLAWDAAGATVQEVYSAGGTGLLDSFTQTIRSVSGTLTAGLVTGDGANDGVEVQIPLGWLLNAPTNGGGMRVAVLNGNGANNFWSDSTIPQNSNGDNLGFPGVGAITAMAALAAPRFSWITYVDGAGDGNSDGVDSHDTITAALVSFGPSKGTDGIPDIIEVLVDALPNHPGILINGGTVNAPGGAPPFVFPPQTDNITIYGDGDGNGVWARVQMAAGTGGTTTVGAGYSFATARFPIEVAINQRVIISDFVFMPQNLGANGGQTTNAASDGGTRMNFMYIDEAIANLNGSAAATGVTLQNILVTGSDSTGNPVDPNAAPVADGTYWASDSSFVAAVTFASNNAGANNFTHYLDNVTIAHGADVCHGLGIYSDPNATGDGTISISNSRFTRNGVLKPTTPNIAASARNGIQVSTALSQVINYTNVVADFNTNHGLNASIVAATADNTIHNINEGTRFSNNTLRGASFTSTGATTTNARNRITITGTASNPVIVANNGNRGFRTENANSASPTQIVSASHLWAYGNGVHGLEFNEFDFQYPTAAGPVFSDCIFADNGGLVANTSNIRVGDTNAVAGGITFNRTTFHDPRLFGANPGVNFIADFSGTNLMSYVFNDCVFSGGNASPADRSFEFRNGSNNTATFNNCAFSARGTGALSAMLPLGAPNGTVGGTGNTITLNNSVERDPVYASTSPASPDYLRVKSPLYAGAATAAADLGGGRAFLGGATLGDIDVAPASHDYGQVVVGLNADQVFTVSNAGEVEVAVSSIGGLAAPYSIQSGPTTPLLLPGGLSVDVTVRFAPAAVGVANAALVVSSDDVNDPTLNVSLTGTGEAPPSGIINVVPGSLAFGETFTNESKQLTVTVSNSNDTLLTVSGLTITGTAEFTVVSPAVPFDLPTSVSTQVVTIQYAPTDAGADSATLEIASDDFFTPVSNVSLTGAGLLAPSYPYVDTFSTNTSANYTEVGVRRDVAWSASYTGLPLSTGTVPEAPRTAALGGDAGLGLITRANVFGATGVANATNVFTNQKFNGNYFVEVDVWGYISDDAGTTEDSMVGINHTATRNISFNQGAGPGNNTDGYWFQGTVDGGGTGNTDYHFQKGNPVGFSDNAFAGLSWTDGVDGSVGSNARRGNTEPFFTNEVFPTAGLSQTGTVALGANGGQWVTHRIEYVNGIMIVKLNGLQILAYEDPSATFTYGSVLLGHEDRFPSVADNMRVIFDNLVVDAIANDSTAPTTGTITAMEVLTGDVLSPITVASNGPFTFKWDFVDEESSIYLYEVAFGDGVNLEAHQPFTSVGAANRASINPTTPPGDGDVVSCTVRATNVFGLTSAEFTGTLDIEIASVREWMLLDY